MPYLTKSLILSVVSVAGPIVQTTLVMQPVGGNWFNRALKSLSALSLLRVMEDDDDDENQADNVRGVILVANARRAAVWVVEDSML